MSKGSKPRPHNPTKYGSRHDSIFGPVKKPKKKPVKG